MLTPRNGRGHRDWLLAQAASSPLPEDDYGQPGSESTARLPGGATTTGYGTGYHTTRAGHGNAAAVHTNLSGHSARPLPRQLNAERGRSADARFNAAPDPSRARHGTGAWRDVSVMSPGRNTPPHRSAHFQSHQHSGSADSASRSSSGSSASLPLRVLHRLQRLLQGGYSLPPADRPYQSAHPYGRLSPPPLASHWRNFFSLAGRPAAWSGSFVDRVGNFRICL